MKYLLLLLCVFFSFSYASWQKIERVNNNNDKLNIRFALKQKNVDVLEKTLLDVANPSSPNYGKWWTPSAILDLVAPSAQVSQSVVNYIKANGGLNVENRRDVIVCEMSVKNIEKMFQTNLYVFAHSNGKSLVIRTNEGYTVPAAISQYVDFVSGIAEFPQPRKPASSPTGLKGVSEGYVTVPHIQDIYQIPTSWPNHPDSSIALIEFQDDTSFSDDDLSLFVSSMAIPNITVKHVIGPFNQTYPDAESTLDVQYGGAIAINATVWFWTEQDWMYEFATDLLNTTNPPLVVSMSWGWPEPNQCSVDPSQCGNTTGSTSLEYVARVNVEFAKIGLSGITLIAASGDQGAPGDGDFDCSNTTNPFSTIFPGASPWVLSVGATMLESFFEEGVDADEPPVCSQVKCSGATREEACSYPDALITSGGGFSNVSPRPSFQDAFVNSYFSSGAKLPDDSFYNKSNRAFPDVAALGHNYIIAYDGQVSSVDGTSCSSPVFAGIVALLNSERLNNGKASLGYIVPLVYAAHTADPTTFRDITKGDNKCSESCCLKVGYEAVKGWDPVTGLGTPQFPSLLKYVQSLN